MPKSVCFDVLGTCFHFQPLIDLIATILRRTNSPVDAPTLFHAWFYAAQRDFTYVSVAGSYVPIASVLRQTFRRACAIVDVNADVTDEDIDALMTELRRLPARRGLKELFDGLRADGWDVYAVTNGGKDGSLKYFELAGVPLDGEHLLSCDDLQVAKPDARVYENANAWLEGRGCERVDGEGRGQRWFVAAHSWDLIAARKAGFRTAWVAHEERDPVKGVFGEFDVYAEGLEECLERMRSVA